MEKGGRRDVGGGGAGRNGKIVKGGVCVCGVVVVVVGVGGGDVGEGVLDENGRAETLRKVTCSCVA